MSLDGNLGLDLTARDLTGPAFASLQANLDSAQKKSDALKSSMGGASAAGGVFGAVLAGLQVGKLIDDFVKFNARVIEQTAGFKNLADRLQLTTTQYQALRLAGIDAGVSQEQLQTSLAKFGATIGQAEQGNKAAIGAFQQLGVNILDASGKIRPMTDLLAEAASALLQMQDGTLKTRTEVQLFGRAGVDLNPMLVNLAKGVDALQQKFAAGLVSPEVVQQLHELEVKSAAAQARFDAMYATVAAPVYIGGIMAITNAMTNLGNRINAAKFSWFELVEAIGAGPVGGAYLGARMIIGSPDPAKQLNSQIADKQKELDSINQNIANHPGARVAGSTQKRQADLQAQLDQLTAQKAVLDMAKQVKFQQDDDAARGDHSLLPGDTFQTKGAGNPAVTSSGKGTKADKVGDAIAKLKGETAAANAALAYMIQNASMPLDLLNKQIDLQKKTDDAIAAIGGKASADPRVAQLKAAIVAHVEAQAALKREQEAVTEADKVNRQYGDGQAALTETTRKLNDALATGALDYDAYSIAIKKANEAARAQALTMLGQQGGLTGLAAGFIAASDAYAKQNTAFQAGGQIFQQTSQLMSQAFTNWRKTGQLDMGAFLASWADMLEQMALKAATSQVFNSLSDMIGKVGDGGGGGLSGFIEQFFTTRAANTDAANNISAGAGAVGAPAFADGGRPVPGDVSLVGEQGPELFVPDTAGTVVPNHALTAGGGGGVTVHQTITVSAGVSQTVRAEMMALLPQFKKAAIDGVQEARHRGGTFAAAFRR